MTKKLNLTPADIDRLRTGKIPDTRTPGLYIEATGSGKLVWKYRRRIAGGAVVNMRLGLYNSINTIAAAREWGRCLNAKAETGIDPSIVDKNDMTMDQAHAIYMNAVETCQHRPMRKSSTVDTKLRSRTVSEKLRHYDKNVSPYIGTKRLKDISADDISGVILKKREYATVQANRLGAELNVFMKFCRSSRGRKLGIPEMIDASSDIADLWATESKGRDRWLDENDLPIFLKALALEKSTHRRAMLLWLLTGTRYSELVETQASDLVDGVWIISADRSKNHNEHPIPLGPWALQLFASGHQYVIPSSKKKDAPLRFGWTKIFERVRKNMAKISGRDIEHFTPHDLRRTFNSWLDELGVSELLQERMMNHAVSGLRYRYVRSKRSEEMRATFLMWDQFVARMAVEAGVGDQLDVRFTTAAEPQPNPEDQLS